MFFNRQSPYLWAQTVLLFSPICSFIRIRQTSYRGFSRTTKRSQPDPLIYLTFRYVDDILSLNRSRFGDFVDRIYPIELEIDDTTDTDKSASYLDLHLEIDSEARLRTKLYDKRDYFNFPIVNLIYMQEHSSSACIWSIYLSVGLLFQSLWFISDFRDAGLLPTRKLIKQWYYGTYVSQMTTDIL